MQSSGQFSLFNTLLLLLFFFFSQLNFLSPLPASTNEWLQRRNNFYQLTSFDLSQKNVNLLGEDHHEDPDSDKLSSVHLPFYFDFELYKTLYNKKYTNPEEELARHDVFIKACIRILRNNVAKLGRNNVPENVRLELSANDDKFYEEKVSRTSARESSNLIAISWSDSTTLKPEQDVNTESFRVEFGPRVEGELNSERPLDKAVRLVRLELGDIEEKELLKNYLLALNMDERKCLPVKKEKWPYWKETKVEEKEKDKEKEEEEVETKNT